MAKYIPDMRVGDDYEIRLVVTDVTGDLRNITGYKFWLTLKSSFGDTDENAALQFSSVVGDNFKDDALNGVCYLTLPNSVTKNITAGSYFYDIQLKSFTTGALMTVLPPIDDYKDKIIVVPDVTQSNI